MVVSYAAAPSVYSREGLSSTLCSGSDGTTRWRRRRASASARGRGDCEAFGAGVVVVATFDVCGEQRCSLAGGRWSECEGRVSAEFRGWGSRGQGEGAYVLAGEERA